MPTKYQYVVNAKTGEPPGTKSQTRRNAWKSNTTALELACRAEKLWPPEWEIRSATLRDLPPHIETVNYEDRADYKEDE